jgi:ubiquinone biosynthesis protein
VYIKLGQIAATRVDLVPPEICAELAQLQNRVEPEPIEVIRPAIEAELGGDVSTVFAEFDWEPLAAASIGQTYRARLHSGEAVVVKVQRPGIDAVMHRDLAALSLLASFLQRNTALGQHLRTGELLDEFAKGLRTELDFRVEADAMIEMATWFGDGSVVRVPEVYRRLCTKRLLVQERFEGYTLADADTALGAPGLDRHRLGEQLIRCELEQILQIGFFHADPHPGNIFVLEDGSLGLIDFGAVGRLDPIQQAAVRDMIAALMTRNVSLLRDGIERVADLNENVSPDQLERALARFVAENVRSSGAVSPSAFQDLVALLAATGIHLPGDLVVLSRSLMTLDGTLRVISPDLNLIASATAVMASPTEPVLDRDEIVREELLAMLPQLRRLPDRVDRVLSLTGRGELRVRSVVDEDGQRIVRTLANRALLALVGTAFLVVAALLLTATDDGPLVSGGTGLFEIFGYGGLLAGMILLLRVVAAVARDGTT